MRRRQRLPVAVAMIASLLVVQTSFLRVVAAGTPSLVISQLKITASSGQFVTLYNTTNTTLDLSKYQLEYFNNYDFNKATSNRLITLSGTVPPHGYFMVNDSAMLLCYQLTVDSVSLGFSSTAGMVEVLALNQTSTGGSATPAVQDYVGWSKTTVSGSGVQTLPANTSAFLQRLPVDNENNPAVTAPGTGSWQSVRPDASNACNLVGASSANSGPVVTGLSHLLPSTEPPVFLFDAAADSGTTPASMPVNDFGLMAPVITEVLPNPSGSGNDSTDEFIELYNANATSFDLSGFSLQTGATNTHTFMFPSGTTLLPQSFTAFYAKTTGLSLSNTGGLVKLFDPLGNSIATTGMYATAKDGQAWALANGKWYWTTTPTPGKANVVHAPFVAATASKKEMKKKAAAQNKTAPKSKKKTATKTKKTKHKKAKTVGTKLTPEEPVSTPIHMHTLAVIAGLALLYGAYEYRTDLANQFHRLRRNINNRHEDGG